MLLENRWFPTLKFVGDVIENSDANARCIREPQNGSVSCGQTRENLPEQFVTGIRLHVGEVFHDRTDITPLAPRGAGQTLPTSISQSHAASPNGHHR